jgi:hypothetical protein
MEIQGRPGAALQGYRPTERCSTPPTFNIDPETGALLATACVMERGRSGLHCGLASADHTTSIHELKRITGEDIFSCTQVPPACTSSGDDGATDGITQDVPLERPHPSLAGPSAFGTAHSLSAPALSPGGETSMAKKAKKQTACGRKQDRRGSLADRGQGAVRGRTRAARRPR